uniref:Uncharacterized protein n=1 Tax=Oryza brachyantha TaxID=4533 RepID=J3L2X5_ORYBR
SGEKPPQFLAPAQIERNSRSKPESTTTYDVPEYVPAALEPRHCGRRGRAPSGGAAVRRPGRGRPSVLRRRLPRLPDLHEVLHRSHHLSLSLSLSPTHDRTQRGSSGGR